MSSRDVRPLLVLGFCCATAGVLLGLAVAPDYPLAAPWVVAIVAFYVAGAWAVRRRPDLLAARRLLLTGVVATAWFAVGMAELLWYDAHGPGGSLWLLNALVLALDLALPVSVMAMLATYPNGEATSAAVRLMIRAGWALVIAVPAASLLSGARQVPAYVLVWNEELSPLPGRRRCRTSPPSARQPWPCTRAPWRWSCWPVRWPWSCATGAPMSTTGAGSGGSPSPACSSRSTACSPECRRWT